MKCRRVERIRSRNPDNWRLFSDFFERTFEGRVSFIGSDFVTPQLSVRAAARFCLIRLSSDCYSGSGAWALAASEGKGPSAGPGPYQAEG